MIRCQNCSAPLEGFTSRCAYCGSANDIDRDLLAQQARPAGARGAESRYACPVCALPMEVLVLEGAGTAHGAGDGPEAGPVTVDQCGKCHGLLFPFYRLEPILGNIARYGFLVDAKRLQDLAGHPVADTVAYRKCPVCGKLMNRINFGQRSGVITDQCHGHGVWLDSGELKRLVEWRNSGGQLLADEARRQAEREREKRRLKDREKIARWRREAGRDGDAGL